MTYPTNDSPASVEEIEELLKRYKRYPYGTNELPHITGAEATARINQLLTEARIDELRTVNTIKNSEAASNATIAQHVTDHLAELEAALKDGGKQ